MSYQIDQSGKIEHTTRETVIAIANGKLKTIKISATEKRKLIKSLIELRRPHKTYTYDIFAALIFVLLMGDNIPAVEIDKEYIGHEAGIKERLLQLFQKSHAVAPEITFGLVGKKSHSHIIALSVFQGKEKPTITIKADEVIKILYRKPIKKGWRSRSSRENP